MVDVQDEDDVFFSPAEPARPQKRKKQQQVDIIDLSSPAPADGKTTGLPQFQGLPSNSPGVSVLRMHGATCKCWLCHLSGLAAASVAGLLPTALFLTDSASPHHPAVSAVCLQVLRKLTG
jgi:hypothetical protein